MSGIGNIGIPNAAGMNPLQLQQWQKAQRNGPQETNAEKIEDTAKKFEAAFLNILMNEMQKTVPDSGFLSDGTTKQIQGLFWQKMADTVADQGGLGLAKQLSKDFARVAGLNQEPPKPQIESVQ